MKCYEQTCRANWERQPGQQPHLECECSDGPSYATIEVKPSVTTAVAIVLVIVIATVGTWIGGLL